MSKKVLLGIVVVLVIVTSVGYGIYLDFCDASPECACRNSAPGDPTCMSKEALIDWCLKQDNYKELPQCSEAPNQN